MHTSGSTARWLPCSQRSIPQSQKVSKGKEEERCLLRLGPSSLAKFSSNHNFLTICVSLYMCMYIVVLNQSTMQA